MVGGGAAPAPDATSKLATRTRTAPSRTVLLVLLGLVAILDGLGLRRIHPGQVAGVGLQLDLADLRLAEAAADALVGHEVRLPVGDAALLGQITELPLEVLDPTTGLHIGRREVPHVVAILRLLALGRRAGRGAGRAFRRALGACREGAPGGQEQGGDEQRHSGQLPRRDCPHRGYLPLAVAARGCVDGVAPALDTAEIVPHVGRGWAASEGERARGADRFDADGGLIQAWARSIPVEPTRDGSA